MSAASHLFESTTKEEGRPAESARRPLHRRRPEGLWHQVIFESAAQGEAQASRN